MIKHALWEGLSSGVGSQIGGETERLVDGQVRLDDEHGGTGDLCFLEDVSTTTIQHTVDTTDSDLRALDFAQIDGLHNTWCGGDVRSVQDTTSSWNDLATTTVDSVSMQCNIIDVESDSAHVFFSKHTFLGGPLETSDNRVLDFVQVLHTLGAVDNDVRASAVRAKAPDPAAVPEGHGPFCS